MILFFYGPNHFAAREKITGLVKRYKSKAKNDFGLERFDGSDTNLKPEQLIAATTNLPLLSNSRLVIIQDVLANKKLAEPLLENLNGVPDSTVVVVWEHAPDERTKLFKDLKSKAKTVKFEELAPPALKAWVQKAARELGGQLDNGTAELLVHRVGPDQWRLHSELLKLINFDSNITAATIEKLIEPSFQNSIFDLVEALSRGQTARALELYQGLRANKAEPLYVLSMLGWALRNLIVAKAAEDAVAVPQVAQIAKDFRMNPFVVRKSLEVAKNLNARSLKAAYGMLLESDYKLKTTSIDPDLLLDQLIIETGALLR